MLLLYAVSRPIARALAASSTNSSAFDPNTGECIDINGCRTLSSIIWSCFSVIFICTWVAIHPNIPNVVVRRETDKQGAEGQQSVGKDAEGQPMQQHEEDPQEPKETAGQQQDAQADEQQHEEDPQEPKETVGQQQDAQADEQQVRSRLRIWLSNIFQRHRDPSHQRVKKARSVSPWIMQLWHLGPEVWWHQFVLMIVAILAPELMILWAWRQRYSAKAIEEQFKCYGWGTTHGFFVIMGGFALYDGDEFLGYLQHKPGQVDKDYWSKIKERHQKITHQRSITANSEKPANPSLQEIAPTEALPQSNDSDCENRCNSPEPTCLLEYLVEIGQITISESEINDRSRGDFITKSIAIIQTTWFIAQVIARAIQGLAITELEIVTVGFTILTLGTCIAWWSKPLRVRYPLRVDCGKQGYTRKQPVTFWGLVSPVLMEGLKEYWVNVLEWQYQLFTCKSEPDDSHPDNHQAVNNSDLESVQDSPCWSGLCLIASTARTVITYALCVVLLILGDILVLVNVVLIVVIVLEIAVGTLLIVSELLVFALLVAILSLPFLVPIRNPAKVLLRRTDTKDPRFIAMSYAGAICASILLDQDIHFLNTKMSSGLSDRDDPLWLYSIVYGLGVVFSGIHFIPWSFQFPTHSELILWRISATMLAAAPLLFAALHWSRSRLLRESEPESPASDAVPIQLIRNGAPSKLGTVARVIATAMAFLMSATYIAGRIILLVLALMALRDLPSSAYQNVRWSQFTPHIS